MSDRYFVNNFPDFTSDEEESSRNNIVEADQLFPSNNKILQAAFNLKNQILQATWITKGAWASDPTLYTGLLGTAFMYFRAYQTGGDANDLELCMEITNKCAVAAMQMEQNITFLCGQPGVYALGAAAANLKGDSQRLQQYLGLFNESAAAKVLTRVPPKGRHGLSYELLYGLAGFLWAALFINKYVGNETVPLSRLGPIVDAILAAGRASATRNCPLMYEWYGTRYWGAAHGLAGIVHVLMHFPLRKEDVDDVKGTLRYMIRYRFRSGNYPTSEGDTDDKLVHWCHGAPGVALTLCKAAQVFPSDTDFKTAAIDAGEVVWKFGLLRRVGLCHGVSGNAYTFLALYRLTGEKSQLHRAKCFSSFLYNHAFNLIASGKMHGGDHPYSLFEGLAGTACLWLDMVRPDLARFPGYEL